MKNHYVYYLFDQDSLLLYIGRSDCPRRRQLYFEKRTGLKTKLGLNQRFTQFIDACSAELNAIKRHQPPYNKRLISSPGPLGIPIHKGKPCSPETRAKIAAANRGKIRDQEQRARISVAQKKIVRARGASGVFIKTGID